MCLIFVDLPEEEEKNIFCEQSGLEDLEFCTVEDFSLLQILEVGATYIFYFCVLCVLPNPYFIESR